MTFSQRFEEIRTGFEQPFWIANISELFERLSYYAVFAVLARYLHEGLHFDVQRASSLTGMFGGWVWFLAVIGGAVADRLGFRRALSLAYLILSVAYFLMGSIGSPWLAPLRSHVPLVGVVAFILILPALGVAMVKPCVVGTTARASKENVRSVGYSIYYTLVNVGSTAGPLLASWAQEHGIVENVFRIAALSVFLMFFFVLLLFKEPRHADEGERASLRQVGKNFLTVLSNPRFMLFLLIFTGYWIVFWQEFIALPLYISAYIDPKADTARILATDPIVVICFTMVIGFLTKRMRAFHASRSRNADHECGLDSFDRSSVGLDGGRDSSSGGNRRDHSTTALLRLYFAPCPLGTAGNVYGICFSSARHRIVRSRTVQRLADAPFWRRTAPTADDLVVGNRGRHSDNAAALDL